jgi:hypothetical protein
MENKIIYFSYKGALLLLHDHLIIQDNLSQFCREHNISYKAVNAIKNLDTKKKYSFVCLKLLKIFNYKVSLEKLFIVKTNIANHGNENQKQL